MASPRELVGRANSYLLIIKRVVAEVVYLPRTINFPAWFSGAMTKCRLASNRCRRREIVSRIFSGTPSEFDRDETDRGQFYVVTAKTSDKSYYRSRARSMIKYYADVRIAVPAHAARYLYVARLRRRRHGGFNNEYAIVVSKSIDNSQAKL